MIFPPTGEKLFLITLYSNDEFGEIDYSFLYRNSEEDTIYELDETLPLDKANMIVGHPYRPFQLTIKD
jgi:hypothetical protein